MVLWIPALIIKAVAHPEMDVFLVMPRPMVRIHVLLLPDVHKVIPAGCVLQLPQRSLPERMVEIHVMTICVQVLSLILVVLSKVIPTIQAPRFEGIT